MSFFLNMSPAFYFGNQAVKSGPGEGRCNPTSCTDVLNLHESFSQRYSQIVCECTVADFHADTGTSCTTLTRSNPRQLPLRQTGRMERGKEIKSE